MRQKPHLKKVRFWREADIRRSSELIDGPLLSIVAFHPVGPLAAMCFIGMAVVASFSDPASPTRNICYVV
jgi:hypothetical protein